VLPAPLRHRQIVVRFVHEQAGPAVERGQVVLERQEGERVRDAGGGGPPPARPPPPGETPPPPPRLRRGGGRAPRRPRRARPSPPVPRPPLPRHPPRPHIRRPGEDPPRRSPPPPRPLPPGLRGARFRLPALAVSRPPLVALGVEPAVLGRSLDPPLELEAA